MELYSTTIADRCLGSYLSRPELILDSNYPVRKEDFVSQFHQIIYVTLYNLYTSGCQSFSLMDINEYLKPYEAQYNIYKDSDGDNYIQVITELTDPDNFDYYYEQLRKFSCLRMYREKGYDIDVFYDVTKSEETQLENLNKYTIQDIINHYDGINLDIRQEFLSGMTETECNEAGDGLDEFLDRLSETPLYGVSFLSDMLNAATRGLMDGQLTCFSSPSGVGKAQPVDTIIPTPNGSKRLGDLKIGDYVFDKYGKPTKILGVFPQGVIDTYKVTLKDGRTTYCNNEHLWNVISSKDKCQKEITVDTNYIIDFLNEHTLNDRRDATISIPMPSAINYPEKNYRIDPYVIGSFLGNGCCKEKILSYSSSDIEQVNEVARLIKATPRKNSDSNYTWTFSINSKEDYEAHENNHFKNSVYHTEYFFKEYLDNLCGYAHEKSIPTEYKYGSIEQRYSLLQGLFDTDGHIAKGSRENRRYNVTYSTMSLQLAKDIAEVLYSLGYSASITSETRVKYKGKSCYSVNALIPNEEKQKLFRLSRKKNIAIEASNYSKRRHYDRIPIKSVEKLPTQSEMVCIYVDNEEHLYLTNDYIVTHNTSVACGLTALLCAPKYWSDKEGKFVDNPHKTRNGALYIQYELDNVTELSPKFLAFITNIPVSKMLDNDLTGEERVRLKEGSKILKESNIHMVYMPNFTRQSIDDTVKQHIIKYGIDFFIMDYISDVPSLNAEMVKANGGVGLRTDQVLAGFSSFLKDIARKYNIPVYTMTQTNANLGTEATIGAESISGSRAVANKLDIGGVFLNLRPKEEKAYEEIKTQIVQHGFGHKMCDPTHIYHMYKTRFGSLPQNVKIWVNFDNGTCRMVDCFCTDWQNKLLKVTPVELVKLVEKEIETESPITTEDINNVF